MSDFPQGTLTLAGVRMNSACFVGSSMVPELHGVPGWRRVREGFDPTPNTDNQTGGDDDKD